MEQYISKSALVAEIDALLDDEFQCDSYDEATGFQNALTLIEKFLDTLEVKEVDLEKEVANWWKGHYKNLKNDYKFEGYNGHYMENSTIISLAQHFYELGLKAQKGE